MSLIKSTSYAPEIYRNLNGILLIHKQPNYHLKELVSEIQGRICDSLNQLEPRPLSRRLAITGDYGEEKSIVDVPNLADHPLVVGPRYSPKELYIKAVAPYLGFRSSGLTLLTLGRACGKYNQSIRLARLPNIYHVCGQFGFRTHNHFRDGNILDKNNYHKIRSGKLDSVLAKIENSQRDRLFDASRISIHSQEAYELAQSWPSKPAGMATWPVIYRLRCIHLKLPHFKLEVTVINESESFLAHLVNDIGIMMRSSAFTESVRRVKYGPFTIEDSFTEKQWDMQSIIDNLKMNHDRLGDIISLIRESRRSAAIRTEHRLEEIGEARAQSG